MMRTVGELKHDYTDALQILMNPKAHHVQKKKALEDITIINQALFDQGLVLTITIGVEKR